ncbi:MAG: GNAT family N-acetyltransferase [Clostridiales bacterium]|jgi:GNAT superfamily N-acetyltransferase|nr:GNAT family N-acetyltransferase [Clostridiales bacterium]
MIENITIKPLTPDLAADYFDFFDNRAFSDNVEWSCCYCTYFHMNEESEREVDDEVKADGGSDALRRALRSRAERFIAECTLHGYLAYADGVPIGFCNANDKSAYARHINEMALDDGGRTKAAACFVIAPNYRGQGVATALLARVVSDAKAAGYNAVEGYPKRNETGDAFNFTGPERLYEKAGFTETARLDDRAVVRKVFERKMEDYICETLAGDAQNNASVFAAYLRAQDMEFERGTGYWEDKRYWMIKYKGEYLCFILINGRGEKAHKDEPEGWIIWFDGGGHNSFEDALLDEYTKELAWRNVDYCGHCGGVCDGGTHKIIFGKKFEKVCNTTFRFDNPDSEAVECAKKLVEIRKDDIWRASRCDNPSKMEVNKCRRSNFQR